MAFNTDVDIFYLRTNPLGMKGDIAKRYGEVVQDLWGTSYRSIAPLKLRVSTCKAFLPHLPVGRGGVINSFLGGIESWTTAHR